MAATCFSLDGGRENAGFCRDGRTSREAGGDVGQTEGAASFDKGYVKGFAEFKAFDTNFVKNLWAVAGVPVAAMLAPVRCQPVSAMGVFR